MKKNGYVMIALAGKSLRRLACLMLALSAAGAQAVTFTVSHTGDAGAGSLRQAIADANAMTVTGGAACAPHTIVFAIPGAGVHTIPPESPLPAFAIGITLNGYSQPGASFNTLDSGNNAVLRIVLDGSLAGASHALVIAPRSLMSRGVSCSGSGSVISGLAINPAATPTSCGVRSVRTGRNCVSGSPVLPATGMATATDRT